MTPPKRILITGARAPVALHLCRLLASNNCAVFLADTFDFPLAQASNRHSGYITLPSPRFDLEGYAAGLTRAVAEHGIELIIPTCEEVFFLAILAERGDLAAPLLAPDLAMLTATHNKFQFIELARSFGLSVPDTRLLESAADLSDTDPKTSVYKPVWSRFASQVFIKPSTRTLSKVTPTKAAPWVVQECIIGEEFSVYAVARNGKPIACAIYRSIFKAGKGAGVCFENVKNENVTEWVFEFIKRSGWDGQISFDFMRRADGSVVPLECNPRATSGLHFFGDASAFSRGFWQGERIEPDVNDVQALRLALWIYGLPQAMFRGRLGAFKTCIQQAHEVLDWHDDHGPVAAQFRALREMIKIAVRERITLQQASSLDIEWNGPDKD